MKASLDTNVIIHLYRANLQNILFQFFKEGVYIYEMIRNVELEHHGQDVLKQVDADIAAGKIKVYTDQKLADQQVKKVFNNNVRENRYLYGSGDLGEVYAISLAQTIGAYALVTDDIKQGGPYMSLLQFDDNIMPFTFADVLILRYLIGDADVKQTIADFYAVNSASSLNWSFRAQIAKFIRRFYTDPYRYDDTRWINGLANEHNIKIKSKLLNLKNRLP